MWCPYSQSVRKLNVLIRGPDKLPGNLNLIRTHSSSTLKQLRRSLCRHIEILILDFDFISMVGTYRGASPGASKPSPHPAAPFSAVR